MARSLQVEQEVIITPTQPTPNHILQLSALDSQLIVRFTFGYFLVYNPGSGIDRDVIADNVKSALGRALVPYYPLAGRVRARADGLGLEVVCESQGALFIHAVSTNTVPDFDEDPQRTGYWRKFLSLHVDDVLEGTPPLVVQLTWLQDGGAVLAVGFNHCLIDGVGSGEFLNSFSGLALGKRELSELNPSPTWSRHLLNPMPSGLNHDDSLSLPVFKTVKDVCGITTRFVRERLIPTRVTFDENRVKELKKLTKSTHCTSFEVVAAHVWRSWVRALNLPSHQTVKLVFNVNIRQRVSPSLPSGYYGNAFVSTCAEACAAELSGKGLGYAAELVARAKERVGDEYVREVVESVSWKGAIVDPVGALFLTPWSRIGLETVDFGMGKPVQVGPVCCYSFCIVSPVCGAGNAYKVDLPVPLTALDQYLYLMRNINV